SHRLPAVYPTRMYVAEGGLLSYGWDIVDQYRSAAVDRILRGQKWRARSQRGPSAACWRWRKEEVKRKAAEEKAEGLQRVGSLLGEFDSDCPAVYRAYEQKEDGKGGVILSDKTTGQRVHIQSPSRGVHSVNGTPMHKREIVAWMMENMRRA